MKVAGLAVLLCTIAHGASANDAPAVLRRTEACMIKVLKRTPGVEGIVSQMPPAHMDDTERYLFLTYSFKGARVSFFAIKNYVGDRIDYSFMTFLSGFGSGPAGPNDWGTGDIERKWKRQCGANAGTLFQ